VLLYVHGGGFVLPSVHEAADDLLAAYKHPLDKGIPAEKIRIAADSSSGFLATALLADLERAALPLPAAVLLLSPLVDLSVESAKQWDKLNHDPSIPENERHAESIRDAGGSCELRLWPGQIHGFAIYGGTKSSRPGVQVVGQAW
jgi:acetyl esterase/lipase